MHGNGFCPVCGSEGLIGEIGMAKGRIRKNKTGKVFVHGEIWDAVSEEDIAKGKKIQVVKIDGMVLTIKAI